VANKDIKQVYKSDGQDSLLPRLALRVFRHPRRTALIWLLIAAFGALSYTTLLKKEGFPPVSTPFAISTGSYIVHDPGKVDKDIAKPLSNYLLKQDGVKTVIAQSYSDFYNVIINYNDGVNAEARSKELTKQVAGAHILPSNATLKIDPYKFGYTSRGDKLVVAFYSKNNSVDSETLVAKAKIAGEFIKNKHLSLVTDVSAIDPFEQATDPTTGQTVLNQKSFDRYGVRKDSDNKFYTSVVIGVQAKDGTDNIKLDEQVQSAVNELNKDPQFAGYQASISGSFAPQIKLQINTLQTALLEGLASVLIIGSLIIAFRASVITVLSMLTVLAAANAVLWILGYTLNTITLFALILGLSLIVDDTIIMVEALDAQRQRQKTADKTVEVATRKVSRAMVAATSTAILSFAPLLFVGGILGSFIRAIPVTIITSLFVSLLVALFFIPMFARYLLLGKKQLGQKDNRELAAGFEAAIARFVSGPMLWAKGSTKKLFLVGIVALVIGFGFIGAGGALFQKVTFNIFPNSKDSDQLATVITFPANTDIARAQQITDEVDAKLAQTLGSNFDQASYYGMADIQMATLQTDITSYKDRDVTAPELAKQVSDQFKDFKDAHVETAILDVAGPPAAAFVVQVRSDTDRPAALKLADDIAHYVKDETVIKRADGSVVKIKTATVGSASIYNRKDDKAFVPVNIAFVDDDTSTIITLTKNDLKKHYTAEKVASFGLPKDALQFDSGQEQENQDSFKTLAIAFPALLFAIFVLLAIQFRSLAQPLLIFLAIPFSLFGISLGLYKTDNPFSFFTMLGFFALIGLSIKNTILLTDYANQARRAGMGTIDSAHEALAERFRPLIATSLTAVCSLIPLTLSDPFWQGLGVTLIFGLLSSTFLVITVFPYYYLGVEYLRLRVSRKAGLFWLFATIILSVVLIQAGANAAVIPLIAIAMIFVEKGYGRLRRRRA
jgi:multidrug efflux pump subunit AcrB